MSAPLSAPLSIREFARREGCDDKLVRRAIADGKLSANQDGRLNPDLVGTGWRRGNRHPPAAADTVRTGADTSADMSAGVSALPPPVGIVIEHEPQPQGGALKRTRKAPQEDDSGELDAEEFARRVLSGDTPALATSERVKAAAQALKYSLAAQKLAGAVVEIEVAQEVLFEAFRAARDAWLNWPSRVGPLLAADLGLEADRVLEALLPYVHQQLADLGEPEADFSSPDADTD